MEFEHKQIIGSNTTINMQIRNNSEPLNTYMQTKLINIQTQIQTPYQIMKNQGNFSWSSFTPHPERKIKSFSTYELHAFLTGECAR